MGVQFFVIQELRSAHTNTWTLDTYGHLNTCQTHQIQFGHGHRCRCHVEHRTWERIRVPVLYSSIAGVLDLKTWMWIARREYIHLASYVGGRGHKYVWCGEHGCRFATLAPPIDPLSDPLELSFFPSILLLLVLFYSTTSSSAGTRFTGDGRSKIDNLAIVTGPVFLDEHCHPDLK